jgi:predicted dehydrogenase
MMRKLMLLRKFALLLLLTGAASHLFAQQPSRYKIAVVGLVHSHVWGHLATMVEGKTATLVGISERNPELIAEAKKAGVRDELFFPDYRKMLDQTRPDIVWAFVENNRHLEIAAECAPRHINVIFEKPLASTYADAKQIQALAEKYDIRVMTNYQMAWWPSNYAAKAAVDRGETGTVYRLHGVVGHGGPGSEGARNKFFFDWLTDPVKNGAGALIDFGCYNALWSIWYLGMPEAVYATALHLRPERFPKVEDAATIVLTYPSAVGIFEGSWDLPRSFQDLEVFGRPDGKGSPASLYMTHTGVKVRGGREERELTIEPLPADEAEPVAHMVSRIRAGQQIQGLTAIDINVKVIRIIELAKESIKTGRQVAVAPDHATRP